MNVAFAKKKLDKIANIASKDKDGFFGMYFDRSSGKFTGMNVGMTQKDAVALIDQVIETFELDKAVMADYIRPAIILPYAGKPDNAS